MFYRFWGQDERRAFGGGDFYELQFCRLPAGTPIKRIVDVGVEHWRNDSLYVPGDDTALFDREYGEIFTGGACNNLQSGPWDWCGINYYDPGLTEKIIAEVLERKPRESTKLLLWLYEARGYNGFYLLGV